MGNQTSIFQRGHIGLETARSNLFVVPSASILPRESQYDATGRLVSATSQHTYIVYHNAARIGVGAIAGALLLFCALLAGLTLAICGLDDTLVRMRVATGTVKERRQAAVILQMKRHGSWMLCSLIICSCACGETFPFLVQSMYHGPDLWVPITISTLCIAIIAEIIPQHLIPRNAIVWGYYCWPVIWGCMVLTSPVSYPIAWLLDTLFSHKIQPAIFTNDQLEELIRYHDRSEKQGGQLGQDAARVAVGALKLESRTIGAEMMRIIDPIPEGVEMDIEKAEIIVAHGLIVKWSAVKTINIDESVDDVFLQKVKGWSYSRLPVINKADIGLWVENEHKPTSNEDWDGTRIYGFLHTRNLLDVDFKSGLRVKDLPLYPLPVVRESMSVYELLNMFQLGISRMAVVVASAKPVAVEEIPNVLHDPAQFSTMHWTATKRTNEKIISRMRGGQRLDWTAEFLSTARANVAENGRQQNICGIRAPRPVGIITFEDVIDTILQKASRDEKDFFGRRIRSPLKSLPSIHVRKARKSLKTPLGDSTLRFRTSSKPRDATINNLDGARDRKPSSSYTDDSDGGFHGANDSVGSPCSRYDGRMTALDIADLTAMSESLGNPYSQAKAASLPSRKTQPKEGVSPRHVSASSAPPTNNPAAQVQSSMPASHDVEASGETIMTLSSWCEDYYEREHNLDPESLYDALPVAMQRMQDRKFSFSRDCPRELGTISEERSNRSCENSTDNFRPYEGFPPELLDTVNDSPVSKYASHTLPRMPPPEADRNSKPLLEKAVVDCRAPLPGQQMTQPNMDTPAPRRSSLWF